MSPTFPVSYNSGCKATHLTDKRSDDMTDDLESALKQLLKSVLREVAAEFMEQLKASAYHQALQVTPARDDFLLTPRETAKRLAISDRHLFGLTRTGQLPCVRVGKCVRYNVETILKWVREAESTESPTRTERDESKQTPMNPTAKRSRRRKPNQPARQAQRGPATEKELVSERRTPKVRQSVSNRGPQMVQSEDRISPFSVLLSELGIERSSLPPITNGDLMRIAEVDIATMHGWLYLNRSLSEEATNRLKNHFRSLVTERPIGE